MAIKPYPKATPEADALASEIIGRVADRWTMEVLEALHESETMRFTQISRAIPGVSQKMLTQTLRQMERDGLVTRTVHPVIPPHVDYALTRLGITLTAAFCDVWLWAEKNGRAIHRAREVFDARPKAGIPKPKPVRLR